ncbi:MAG TPA: TonB family protein [Verrucomicrobiae bacterium]|nr:TonB family protein [Verrucomicrobiae bacterium]
MPEAAQNPVGTSESQEKRAHDRRRVEGLIYVGLGEENGGIVLNMGEAGLEFHAAVALQQNHFPRIRFQLPVSGQWTELAGSIAWRNESGTTAGLRFIGLQEEARAEIQDWVAGKSSERKIPRWGRKTEEISPRKAELEQATVVGAVSEKEEPKVAIEEAIPEPIQQTEDVRAEETGAAESAVAESGAAEASIAEAATAPEEPAPEQRAGQEEKLEDIVAAAVAANEENSAEKPVLRTSPANPAGSFVEPPSVPARTTFGGSYEWERRGGGEGKRKISPWALTGMLAGVAAIAFVAGLTVGRGSLFPGNHTTETAPRPAAPTPVLNPPAAKPATPPTRTGGQSNAAKSIPAASNVKGATNERAAALPAGAPPPVAAPAPNPTAMVEALNPGSVPMRVDMPEEPISASSTTAISATRSVEVPGMTAGELRPKPARVELGELVSHVEPDYPAETIQEQVEGTVKLRVTIAKDGRVQEIEPMGGPPALTGTSVAAVKQWRYRPTLVNGKAVTVQEVVKIVFRLPADVVPAAPASSQ